MNRIKLITYLYGIAIKQAPIHVLFTFQAKRVLEDAEIY